MADPVLRAPNYPNIASHNYFKTSERTPIYNCIAHAVGDYSRWWWPHPDAYWPSDCPLTASIDAFDIMFSSLRYTECENASFEEGVDKIALYALQGTPTHAARQVADGRWSSKIGRYIDVEHTLNALEGPRYGHVVKYYKRGTGKAESSFST